MMSQQFHDKMIKIATESGNIVITDCYEVITFNEFKDELVENMPIPDPLIPFIDWEKLTDTILRESCAYCLIQWNKDTEEYEVATAVDMSIYGCIVKAV